MIDSSYFIAVWGMIFTEKKNIFSKNLKNEVLKLWGNLRKSK